MTHSQATDKYMAMSNTERQAACDRAIANLRCEFCGAAPGQSCSVVLNLSKVLDGFCHCGRWMKYLMDEDVLEMLGPVRLKYVDVVGPGAAFIDDDLGDLLK